MVDTGKSTQNAQISEPSLAVPGCCEWFACPPLAPLSHPGQGPINWDLPQNGGRMGFTNEQICKKPDFHGVLMRY
jgi:hypothetical protein